MNLRGGGRGPHFDETLTNSGCQTRRRCREKGRCEAGTRRATLRHQARGGGVLSTTAPVLTSQKPRGLLRGSGIADVVFVRPSYNE
eukprot:scaffold2497_cov119-Isochrysis_galbana.AAC.6